MSLADNPTAVEAAVRAYAETKPNLTMLDIRQGPGEGNYDRIEEVSMEAALRAAEEAHRAAAPKIQFLSVDEVDEADAMVMEEVGEDEGE